MFALNQGEVCTCPSRALIDSAIYERLLGDGLERVRAMRQGNRWTPRPRSVRRPVSNS